MNTGNSKPEIEKPKPLEVRALAAAQGLVDARNAWGQVFGLLARLEVGYDTVPPIVDAMNEAIRVLQIAAGERDA